MLDFDKLSEAEGKAALQGCDVGFCALGTTRGKSGVVGDLWGGGWGCRVVCVPPSRSSIVCR